MSNEIAKIDPQADLAQVRAGDARRRDLAALVDVIGWQDSVLRRPLTAQERAFLAAQARSVAGLLIPANRAEAAAVVSALLIAFGAKPGESEAAVLVNAYIEAGSRAALWAMDEARANFLAGRVEKQSKTFAPKPPEFLAEIDRIMSSIRMADHQIKTLRIARPPAAPPQKREIPVVWRDMRAAMEARQAELDPIEAPGEPVPDTRPFSISPALAKIIAEETTQRAAT